MSRFVFVLLVALLSLPTFVAQGETQKVVTVRTNETFARGLQITVPGLKLPLSGSFSLEMRRNVGGAAVHLFSTTVGNLRVTATDPVNHKISLALLMSQQDAATLSANYIGDLLYTEGSTRTNLGRLVFMVVQGATSAPPATPPNYSDLAAWGPIADIYGGSDPTIVAALRGLTGPQGQQGPVGSTGPQGPAWTGPVTGSQLSLGAAATNLGFSPLNPANDLSDLLHPAAARNNLGLPASSTTDATKGLGILTSQISTTTFPSAYNSFTVSGYDSAGDAGAGCTYKRVSSTYPGAILSGDGAYWGLEHDNKAVDVACFGAINRSTDQSAQITAAANFAAATLPGSLNLLGNWTNGFFGSLSFGSKDGYRLGHAVNVPRGQRWSGCAAGMAEMVYFGATSPVVTLLPGDGGAIECINLESAALQTGITGIKLGDGVSNFNSALLRNLRVYNYGTGVDVTTGQLWQIENARIEGFDNYGIKINNLFNADSGDWAIRGSTIANNSGVGNALLRWESAGGGKITASKFLGSKIGVDLAFATTGASVDFQFSGNSIENQSIACMKLSSQDSTVRFSEVTITGNEFGGCPIGIWLAGGVWFVDMTSNVFASLGASGVAVRIDNNSNGVSLSGLNANENTPTLLQDNRSDFNEAGWLERSQTKSIKNVSSNSVYTNRWRLAPGSYRAAHVSVYYEGIVEGVGSFSRLEEFMVRNNGTTLVLTSLRSAADGAAIDVNLDVTTTPGWVYIGVRRNAAGGGREVNGTMTMHVDGKTTQLDQL